MIQCNLHGWRGEARISVKALTRLVFERRRARDFSLGLGFNLVDDTLLA